MKLSRLITVLMGGGAPKIIFTDDFSTDKDDWTGATWAVDAGAVANTPTLGSTLVTNGTFGADTNWGKPTGGTIEGGVAVFTNVAAFGAFTQSIGNRVNKYILFQYDLLGFSSGTFSLGFTSKFSKVVAANATYKWGSLGVSDNSFLYLYARAAGTTLNIDNVSAQLATDATLFYTIAPGYSTGKVSADWTIPGNVPAGVVMCLDDAATPANYVLAYHDGVNFVMVKYVAGVRTELIYTAVAYSAGAAVEIIRSPGTNTFRGYYNGSQVGVDQLVTDAGIINNKIHGLFSMDAENTCSEFLYQNF